MNLYSNFEIQQATCCPCFILDQSWSVRIAPKPLPSTLRHLSFSIVNGSSLACRSLRAQRLFFIMNGLYPFWSKRIPFLERHCAFCFVSNHNSIWKKPYLPSFWNRTGKLVWFLYVPSQFCLKTILPFFFFLILLFINFFHRQLKPNQNKNSWSFSAVCL